MHCRRYKELEAQRNHERSQHAYFTFSENKAGRLAKAAQDIIERQREKTAEGCMTEQQIREQLNLALKHLNLNLHPSGVYRGGRASWFVTFEEDVPNMTAEPYPQTDEECFKGLLVALSKPEYAHFKLSS